MLLYALPQGTGNWRAQITHAVYEFTCVRDTAALLLHYVILVFWGCSVAGL